jgi:hypothetical protein
VSEDDFGRPEFREWVDTKPDPAWGLMPLTHICKGLIARDVIREGQVSPSLCPVFDRSVAYFFYGRPAYRVSGDGAIRDAAACPFCFIFDPKTISNAQNVHPFDTGAFQARMFNPAIMDEMAIQDFALGTDHTRPNRLIQCLYQDRAGYFEGDTRRIPPADEITSEGDFLARAYIRLVRSEGRNEVDDRVCTIEVTMGEPLDIEGALMAVVVPDILWNERERTPWIANLAEQGVEIRPFLFSIGRAPDHHHAMIEQEIRLLYAERGYL